MTSSTVSVPVEASLKEVWDFIAERGEWASLLPGYLHHEFPNNEVMIWVFKGDFGIIQKAVKLQVNTTEKTENKRFAFDLIGLSENINGSGFFEIEPTDQQHFMLTGNLNMKAGGFLAGMINPILENFVPQMVEELVNSMAKSITKTKA